MRRFFNFGFLIIVILLTSGCGSQSTNSVSKEHFTANLMFATDLHFYAPELVGDFEQLEKMWERGDGRVAHYSIEIVEALIDKVLQEKPDALVLGGDLTQNGEFKSHSQLADMLKPVKEAGIPVLVVPGNHDINQLDAYSYVDSDYCATIDENGFEQLYGMLGMDDAKSKDKNSLSYMYALTENVYMLMLDTCDYDGFGRDTGSVSNKTLEWIEESLKSAKQEGATVISVSHHNQLPHTPIWEEPFLMTDREALVKLLEHYDVKLSLTGHIHIQHISKSGSDKGLSEAATGALPVSPNYYASIKIDSEEGISYQAEELDVSGWALENGSADERLLNFSSYSRDFFDTVSGGKFGNRLEAFEISDEEKMQMQQFMQLINRYYFAGIHVTKRDELLNHPGYELWQKNSEQNFSSGYLKSILEDASENNTYISIRFSP